MIETLRWEPATGPLRGELHLARARASCATLGFAFDAGAAQAALAGLDAETPLRVRMTFGPGGEVELTSVPFDPASVPPLMRLAFSEVRLDPEDPFLRLKTTRRALYDETLRTRGEGVDEVLFLNSRGELCEGCFTNFFVGEPGALRTPPLSSGLLPGILRQELLETGQAREAVLRPGDLSGARLWVGNALRGLMAAVLVDSDGA